MTTKLHQTILPTHRCISIWHGSHTLTRGRNHKLKQQQETQTSPSHLLLSHLHRNRMQLQHLQTRTAGNHESDNPLATLSNLDQRTIHHPYGPCKPTTLEITSEAKSPHRTMARRTTGLQFQTPTHTRETPYSSRCTIMTHRSRRRQG
jgi:hypothetical protein